VAYMAVGKFARYVVMTAGLLWVFPQHWNLVA
jgi:membrane protein YqaA with SNARE-associated domain